MLKHLSLLSLTITILLVASCRKSKQEIPVPQPVSEPIVAVPPVINASDARSVLIETVNIDHLPSPYFRFTYNDSGYATTIDFASGFFIYNVSYQNKRVTRMTNTYDNSYLLYHYTNGIVDAITSTRSDGFKWQQYHFIYDANHLLKQVEWYKYLAGGGDSVMMRMVKLYYQADSNLAKTEDFRRFDINSALLWSSTTTYSDYDNTVNVEDFYTLKSDFFDHLLYLPQVRMQRNNPGKIVITSAEMELETRTSFEFNAKKQPVRKVSNFLYTKGSQAGQSASGPTTYTYY